jgi:uncharacterized protein YbjT (DUF2867 family)
MDIQNLCILGGSGFVGRALAEHLVGRGKSVRVITRRLTSASRLRVLPTIEIVVGDVHDEEVLTRRFEGMDAVVNLAAILHQRRGQSFQSVHVELPRKVVNACRAAGVPRLLHMSALGAAENAPSDYLRTRGQGENAVRGAALDALGVTIFRPSVIFGADDAFLNLFARLARIFPVVPLAKAGARFQPVWVEDVARAMASAVDDPQAAGKSYELCGPKAYTLEEIVKFVVSLSGSRRLVLPLPDWAATLQAGVLEHLPGPLITRDNLRSMAVDNVCAGPFPEAFGFRPSSMEAIVPGYLAHASLKGRYSAYRYRAGR